MTKLNPSLKSVTIRDVARLAGVSVATISRYLNQTVPIAPETAELVHQAMLTLNYVPDLAARHLASRRTHNIGFLTHSMRGLYMATLLEGIEKTVRGAGYNLMVSTYRPDESEYDRPVFPLGRHNVDGLLVFTGTLTEAELWSLYRQNLPLVLIHQDAPQEMQIPSVTLQNRQAACEVVEHLIVNHGCENIVFVSGLQDQQDAVQRRQGYQDALKKHGLPFNAEFIIPGDFDRETSFKAFKNFLKLALPMQAVFAADDESAAGVYEATREAGLRIPQDVRVIGFDDQIFSNYLSPALSTVQAPTETAGRLAAEKLLEWIRFGRIAASTSLSGRALYRRSCGC
ncbi:MAG: LacI family transcriptional regulator [Anaerolineae bacterium]|nr:LacI family transcriptional regulator [Anaerolineae bacterium]